MENGNLKVTYISLKRYSNDINLHIILLYYIVPFTHRVLTAVLILYLINYYFSVNVHELSFKMCTKTSQDQ